MEAFYAKIIDKIRKKSVPAMNGMGCMLWTGAEKHGTNYGLIKLSPPGRKPLVRSVHRALYMCMTKNLDLPSTLDISHACHMKKCVNFDHLLCENHIQNMERLECHNQGACSKKHFPECIFPGK